MRVIAPVSFLIVLLAVVACGPVDSDEVEEGIQRINERYAEANAEYAEKHKFDPRWVQCDLHPSMRCRDGAFVTRDVACNHSYATREEKFCTMLLVECVPSEEDGVWGLTGKWREGIDVELYKDGAPQIAGPFIVPTEEEILQACKVLPPVSLVSE